MKVKKEKPAPCLAGKIFRNYLGNFKTSINTKEHGEELSKNPTIKKNFLKKQKRA